MRLSLTPCFSWVSKWNENAKSFQRFGETGKTVKTVGIPSPHNNTQLKQGVNENFSDYRMPARRGLTRPTQKARERYSRTGFRQIICFLIALLCFGFTSSAEERKTNIRFEAVDVCVDSGAKPLAAYQLEFRVEKGDAKIVGVEGGSHAAFREPPFYDPKAIQQERVILAAFNTSKADKLPRNKTRVATIHLQISGSKEPEFAVQLKTAASGDGKKISAKSTLERKEP